MHSMASSTASLSTPAPSSSSGSTRASKNAHTALRSAASANRTMVRHLPGQGSAYHCRPAPPHTGHSHARRCAAAVCKPTKGAGEPPRKLDAEVWLATITSVGVGTGLYTGHGLVACSSVGIVVVVLDLDAPCQRRLVRSVHDGETHGMVPGVATATHLAAAAVSRVRQHRHDHSYVPVVHLRGTCTSVTGDMTTHYSVGAGLTMASDGAWRTSTASLTTARTRALGTAGAAACALSPGLLSDAISFVRTPLSRSRAAWRRSVSSVVTERLPVTTR